MEAGIRPQPARVRRIFGVLSGAGDYFTHNSSDSRRRPISGRTSARRARRVSDGPALGQSRTVHRAAPDEAFLSEPSLHGAARAVGRTRGCCHQSHQPRPGPDDRRWIAEGVCLDDEEHGCRNRPRATGPPPRAKLDSDTLVIFTSDNGGERYSFNWPFSVQKMDLWEGGTRVPAIVRWPGVIPAGRVPISRPSPWTGRRRFWR